MWDGRLTSSREIRWRHTQSTASVQRIGDGKEVALGWKSVPHDQRISIGSVRWMPWKFPDGFQDGDLNLDDQEQQQSHSHYLPPITSAGSRSGGQGQKRSTTSHGLVVHDGKAFSRRFRNDLWQNSSPQNFLNVDEGFRPSLIIFDLDLLLSSRLDRLESPPSAWQADENCVIAGRDKIRSDPPHCTMNTSILPRP
jgi:hypothetical protein